MGKTAYATEFEIDAAMEHEEAVTVETHVHHLLNKLGVNSPTQIAVWFSEPRQS